MIGSVDIEEVSPNLRVSYVLRGTWNFVLCGSQRRWQYCSEYTHPPGIFIRVFLAFRNPDCIFAK
jgi:hypothetical protein